jgi:hypothetical protein
VTEQRNLRRAQRIHLANRWVDHNDNITPAGEREAERRVDERAGRLEPDDDDVFGGYGYEPNPYPGGNLI